MLSQRRSSHAFPSHIHGQLPHQSLTPFFTFISISFLLIFCANFAHTMTIKGGTSQACAACQYQRRKCSKDCPLAPFFPADQPEKFHHAHRLYGVRNIMNILNMVRPECKQDAMTSIIFESAMRARFPVYGCLGIINQLQAQLEYTLEELHHVHTRLAICKQQEMSPFSSSSLQLSITPNTDLIDPTRQNHIFQSNSSLSLPMIPNLDLLQNGINNMYINSNYEESRLKPVMIQNHSFSSLENGQSSSLYSSQDYPIQQELDVSQYDDIPFNPILDDRSQESYDSSGEQSLKNKIVEIDYNVLKDVKNSKTELTNAAASFSLTRGQV